MTKTMSNWRPRYCASQGYTSPSRTSAIDELEVIMTVMTGRHMVGVVVIVVVMVIVVIVIIDSG